MNNKVNDVRPLQVGEVSGFDHETDVLVVGYGIAGGSAAYEAAKAGAEVIVLERSSGPGGSSAQSGGELYLGAGTEVQQAHGYGDDNADAMFEYLRLALGPHADEEKLRLYCDGSKEHFEWFRDEIGLEFGEGFYDRPTWMPFTKDGLMWLGENAWPYNEAATPAPRGHRPSTEGFAGWLLMEKMAKAVENAGGVTHTDTRAVRLILDGDRVVGLQARKFGADVTYRARKGVVLTTGGFVDNDEMLADHAPALIGHGKVSDGMSDGSGIRIAQAAGAATRRMGVVEVAYTAIPAMVCRGMLVNERGERFYNEDVYPGLWSHAALHEQGKVWVIMDEKGFEDVPPMDAMGLQPAFAAETIEELAEEIGVSVDGLTRTLDAYNAGARAGQDLFHKDPKWLRELEGPFAAFDPAKGLSPLQEVAPDFTGFNGFTLGGLHTDVDGQVMNISGTPIPGLFAAGRASSGMHGEGYISGTSLGDGSFFGRRAGRKVAAG
ncbi:FAD-dependent oxidoreductase [Enemella sp. A6]|uniref:FAD-dependent oxidoreductase n=1 Tax=Enemella sp. A6 TaxID=3440152 RepID=UPI003EB860C9